MRIIDLIIQFFFNLTLSLRHQKKGTPMMMPRPSQEAEKLSDRALSGPRLRAKVGKK